MQTLNFFRIAKSNIEEKAFLFVTFPAMVVLEEMTEIELIQLIILSLFDLVLVTRLPFHVHE